MIFAIHKNNARGQRKNLAFQTTLLQVKRWKTWFNA